MSTISMATRLMGSNNIKLALLAVALAFAAVFAVAPSAGALSLKSVSPASSTVHLRDDESLVLKVSAETDSGEALRELEIDHSLEGVVPEFSVYANESNPYGSAADRAQFESFGVGVVYSAANQEWTIDFGKSVTGIMFNNGPVITFYFVLYGEDAANVTTSWGSMSPTTPANTFNFTLQRTDDFVDTEDDTTVTGSPQEDTDDGTAPGVPNTSLGNESGGFLALVIMAGAFALSIVASMTYRYFASHKR